MSILRASKAGLGAAGGLLTLALIAGSSALGGDLQLLAQADGGGTSSSRDRAGVGQSTPAFGSDPTPAFGASPTPSFGGTPTPAFGSAPTPSLGSDAPDRDAAPARDTAISDTPGSSQGEARGSGAFAATASTRAQDGIAASSADAEIRAARTSSARAGATEGRTTSVRSIGGDGARNLRTTRQIDAVASASSAAEFRMLPVSPTEPRHAAPAFVMTNDGIALPEGALRSGTIVLP